MKKRSVQTQFFFSHAVIALACIVTLSCFVYNYVGDILMERETSVLLSLTDNLLTNTDSALSTLEDVSLNFSYTQQINPSCVPYVSFDEIASVNDALLDLKDAYIAINGIDYKVLQLNTYDLAGNKLSVGSYYVYSSVALSSLDWVAPTMVNSGTKYISTPYESSEVSSSSTALLSYISMYHVLYDSFGRHIGYVESVQTSKKIFQSVISQVNSSSDIQVYVLNSDGALMYPYQDVSEETLSLSEFYYQSQSETESFANVVNPMTQEKELTTYAQSTYSGFTLICVQAEETILAPIKAFIQLLSVLTFGILCFVFGASYVMSRNLTRPIRQLLSVIHDTQLNTLGESQQMPLEPSCNELVQLNDAFYDMSVNLKNSMDIHLEMQQQELKSRSLALQSQINPHFYYNSLTSIIILAENQQNTDLIHFVKSLTSMMRYVTAGSMQVVPLRDEISYLEKYLYCMKIRYQSTLHYSVDIDPSLLERTVPKLIIQPLIENAIKYGMNCAPPWHIRIYSEILEDKWFIHVEDTGSGFLPEVLEKLHKRMEESIKTIGLPEMHINGMGLLNVYLRWSLFAPDNVFVFENTPQGGARVSIGGELDGIV